MKITYITQVDLQTSEERMYCLINGASDFYPSVGKT